MSTTTLKRPTKRERAAKPKTRVSNHDWIGSNSKEAELSVSDRKIFKYLQYKQRVDKIKTDVRVVERTIHGKTHQVQRLMYEIGPHMYASARYLEPVLRALGLKVELEAA